MASLSSIDSRRFDRKITIQSYTAAQDGFGEQILTWGTLVQCWASAEWPMAHSDEGQEAAQQTATERMDFTIRYLDAKTVEPKMRVQYDSKTYDILAVLPIGRRRFLTLKCESKD